MSDKPTLYDKLKQQKDAIVQAEKDKLTKPLHVEIERLTAERDAARARLDVMTALLRRARVRMVDDWKRGSVLSKDIDAALSEQPQAAP